VTSPSIRINGKKVTAYPGSRIIDLARDLGVPVPTLCDNPLLAPSGYCGVCVVEDIASGRLVTACDTPARPGMDIRTDSPRALEARKRTLELILTNHPETCVICEKGNACQLRDLSSSMGLALSSEKRVGTLRGIVDANPFIHRDLSKCIGCQICVRACREIQGAEAVEFTGIGTGSMPLTAEDHELAGSACELCGLCVTSKHAGIEDRRAKVICPYCGVGCTLELRIREDAIVSVGAGVEGSVNGSSLCVKGRYGLGYVGHPDRLTAPLVREGAELVEATWEEALSRVAGNLRRMVKDHGPDSIGVLASAKATNEENYLIQKFARACIGTNNVDHCARL
jgi:predicted molibdopterin-dependent oxidoreductase YjgC